MFGTLSRWISDLLSRLKRSGTSGPPSQPSPSLPSSSGSESYTPMYMALSQKGVDLIKQWEGLRLTAYRDSVGVPTIGYGHTAGVRMGDRITEDQADKFLWDDTQTAQAAVRNLVKVPLTQGQYDGLTSFVFNLGTGNFASSTLLRRLNAGDYDGAADEFLRWVYAGGKTLEGLARRRAAERDMFIGK